MRLAGSVLHVSPLSQHVCAFFHSHEEEYRVLLPFIQEGFERGEKTFHIVDPTRRDAHLQRLAAAGIDTAAAQQRGQFELHTWTEAHVRDGYFDPDRMRALIPVTLKETQWVLAGRKGAAVRLGMHRSTLAFRMKKLGIVRSWQEGGGGG